MTLNCKEASRLMSRGLDAKLTVSQRLGLGLHLAICVGCKRLEAQFRFLRRALAEYADREARPDGAKKPPAAELPASRRPD